MVAKGTSRTEEGYREQSAPHLTRDPTREAKEKESRGDVRPNLKAGRGRPGTGMTGEPSKTHNHSPVL